MDAKEFIRNHQHEIALLVGYVLVAVLGFWLGRITAFTYQVPEVQIEQAFTVPSVDNNSNLGQVQSAATSTAADNCEPDRIKGNVGSSGLIYHLPGGSFYKRTNAEMCFDTEDQAQAAGFRRSSR
ncbi:MAG: hypothetical protein HYW51_02250 [Candidatus Doudnabacteria bacterium]|nr:hypothetical protein [Candidatus Doudnabacteria bacterium]